EVLLGQFIFGELHVCGQVQAHRSAGHRSRYGIGEHCARRLWTGDRERAQSGRSKHTGPIDCLIIWTQPVGLGYRRRLAVDEEHRRARTTRINRTMQAVGERGSAPDHGHAQPAGGIGVSVNHGYGEVLVSCAVEPRPRSVQRCSEQSGIIAYETKGRLDAHRHNILREHLIEGGRAGPLSAYTLLSYHLHLTLPSRCFRGYSIPNRAISGGSVLFIFWYRPFASFVWLFPLLFGVGE